MDNDGLRVAQLKEGRSGLILISAASETCPVYIKPASSDWQKWIIETLQNIASKYKFHSKDVVASIPPSDVFIDHVKITKNENRHLNEAILTKVKQKLPFSPDQALVKYISAEEDNVIVIASEREKISRHLAIYEKANLRIKSMGVWPVALANSYIRFFGRRQPDLQTVVMLIDINLGHTNLVICRHKNLLFARSIPMGKKQLNKNEDFSRLILEIETCRKLFESLYKKTKISRLVFISGQAVDKEICHKIAKKIRIAAHIGDCLSAVVIKTDGQLSLDRRNSLINWANAFGLSLS